MYHILCCLIIFQLFSIYRFSKGRIIKLFIIPEKDGLMLMFAEKRFQDCYVHIVKILEPGFFIT